MFKFFAKLFSSEKSIEKMVDTVSSGIDKLVYTDEEKAEAAAESRKEARGMLIEWMRASQGQNLTRRFLALIIAIVWLSMYVGAASVSIASVFVLDPSQLIIVANLLISYAEPLNGAVMILLTYYFAASQIDKVTDVAMAKFGKKVDVQDQLDKTLEKINKK